MQVPTLYRIFPLKNQELRGNYQEIAGQLRSDRAARAQFLKGLETAAAGQGLEISNIFNAKFHHFQCKIHHFEYLVVLLHRQTLGVGAGNRLAAVIDQRTENRPSFQGRIRKYLRGLLHVVNDQGVQPAATKPME